MSQSTGLLVEHTPVNLSDHPGLGLEADVLYELYNRTKVEVFLYEHESTDPPASDVINGSSFGRKPIEGKCTGFIKFDDQTKVWAWAGLDNSEHAVLDISEADF